MAINGIRPLGGPSSLSGYGISQPFWIQASNSRSYSPRSRLGAGYSESLFFKDTGGWSPAHFQDAVHTRLVSLWKSGSSRVIAAHISLSRWGNFTSPVADIVIPPNCLIAFSPSSRSYPKSASSTTRARTATEGPLPMPIWTTLSPQHIDEFPPTTIKGTCFFFHVWQHGLRTRVCVQPVSTRAVRRIPSICTLTAGRAPFIRSLGERLALKTRPLARFPDNFVQRGPVDCTDNKWDSLGTWDFRAA